MDDPVVAPVADRELDPLRSAVLEALEQRRGLIAFSKIEAREMDRLARQYELQALERVRGELERLPPRGVAAALRTRLERMDAQLANLAAQRGIAEASRDLERDEITWRAFEDVAGLLGIEA